MNVVFIINAYDVTFDKPFMHRITRIKDQRSPHILDERCRPHHRPSMKCDQCLADRCECDGGRVEHLHIVFLYHFMTFREINTEPQEFYRYLTVCPNISRSAT